MRPSSGTSALLESALAAHQAGELDRARAGYHAVLAQAPQNREALHYLGLLHLQQGRPQVALAFMERAGTPHARVAARLEQLGEVYRALRRYREAESCYRNALKRDPHSIPARGNLGLVLEAQGHLKEARACFESLLKQGINAPEIQVSLGTILAAQGDHPAARERYQTALAMDPHYPSAHFHLGVELTKAGDPEEALRHFNFALRCNADDAEAWIAAAQCALLLERHDSARQFFERAIGLDPGSSHAWAGLVAALQAQGRYTDAVSEARVGLDEAPINADLHAGWGSVLGDAWRMTDALTVLRRAVRLFPHAKGAWTTCLLYSHYVVQRPEDLWRIHAAFGRQMQSYGLVVAPLPKHCHQRLRVGYLSPDFRTHAVGFFILPLLAAHDRTRFEVYCYSNSFHQDSMTEVIRKQADCWRVVAGRGDEEVAALIRADEIDILVDLAGHTTDGRVSLFALRPAPVQVTYLGYPDTTGLPQMDYRITDAWADPPGQTERYHTEALVRLPSGFLCYQPPPQAPEVAPPPVLRRGSVSFGSFNNLAKVTPEMIGVWCEILKQVPDSRMLLKSSKGWEEQSEMKERLLATFSAHGVDASRVVLLDRTAGIEAHLALYGEVDVALDTFPYHGTTTTFEALHMGVPVVTLAGGHHCARVGASILNRVGFPQWVTGTSAEYVERAVALAREPERLAELRTGMRTQMSASGVMDADRFARELERAIVEMWQRYEMEGVRQATVLPPDEDSPPPRLIALAGGERVWVPDDLTLMTPYVLLEQEDWFEDEIRFVRRLLQPGMRTLDIGANYGVYTAALARAVGAEGRVWAVEPVAKTCGYLEQTLSAEKLGQVRLIRAALSDFEGTAHMHTEANAELNRLEAGEAGEAVPVRRLDDLWQAEGMGPLDFIKMDAEGQEENILKGGARCLGETSPLIMFEVVDTKRRNLGLVKRLRGMGYAPYRLVPGLMLLVPWSEQEAADAFQLNLFCCKRDHAERLAERGLLVLPGKQPVPNQAPGAGAAWVTTLPFAAPLRQGWEAGTALPGAADARAALDDFVLAHTADLAPGARMAALERAVARQERALDAFKTPARLATAARFARAVGARTQACAYVQDALERLEAGLEDAAMMEPFLPASNAFDSHAADSLAWMSCMLRTAREEFRHFSSYFTPNESYSDLKKLLAAGCVVPEMERRRQLIRLRYGLQERPEWTALLAGCCNEDYWKQAGQ